MLALREAFLVLWQYHVGLSRAVGLNQYLCNQSQPCLTGH
jgi:hypothetical protein